MKIYESLFRLYKDQPLDKVFAHSYAVKLPTGTLDYDEPFRVVAKSTLDGYDAWEFQQQRFKAKYAHTGVPKLRNYLNYTFARLQDLEQLEPGNYFEVSKDNEWICFNTGLQNPLGSDLLAIFQRYKQTLPEQTTPPALSKTFPDWVFKGCVPPNDRMYRNNFGTNIPQIAWYVTDVRDYVFDITYQLDRDVPNHVFERAKVRAGMPSASDEAIRNYLRGAIENLVPKIKRNYKVAIPVYFVEDKRMQLLMPFASASNKAEFSCFLVEREDASRTYRIKTIFDLDQAYFSARLITRPDREWLDP